METQTLSDKMTNGLYLTGYVYRNMDARPDDSMVAMARLFREYTPDQLAFLIRTHDRADGEVSYSFEGDPALSEVERKVYRDEA